MQRFDKWAYPEVLRKSSDSESHEKGDSRWTFLRQYMGIDKNERYDL